MSLLLEALKKAELAKQAARAEAPSPEPKPEPTKPLMTRERLPDIAQPLEILSDDLPSSETKASEPAAARPEFSLQEQERFEPAAQPIFSTDEFARTAERAQAQQLFQVKEMDYNPRRPFYLTLGALVRVGFDRIRFAADRRGARADRDQCPHARRRSTGRTGLPGVPEERPRRRPRRLPAGARARADQPRRAARPRGHRRAQRPAQLGRSAVSQAARDRPARQPRNGEPHLAARPARPGRFG